MAIAWFIVPYKRDLLDPDPSRYCAMQDAQSVINLDGGDWSETEVLHSGRIGKAIVKVRASTTTLADLATVYRRLPKDALDAQLSDLTPQQRTVLRGELEDMGYPLAEIQARFGNRIQDFTLGDVVRFAAARRLKPRWTGTDIICDGIIQPCRAPDDVHLHCFNDADWTRLKGLRDALMAEWDANQQTIRIVAHPFTAALPKHERDAILVLCGRAGYAFNKIKPDTFPTTGILDDFNRADANLTTPWTIPLYTNNPGTPRVVSNACQQQSDGTDSSAYYGSYGPDSEVHAKLTTRAAGGDDMTLWLRCQSPGTTGLDGYRTAYDFSVTNRLRLWRIDNNVLTQLGSTDTRTVSDGDSMGADAIGSTISNYHKTAGAWSLVTTVTDATYGSSGVIGLGQDSGVYDDFGGGTVVAGGAVAKQKLIQQAVNRASTY